jgi:hypothetical protein
MGGLRGKQEVHGIFPAVLAVGLGLFLISGCSDSATTPKNPKQLPAQVPGADKLKPPEGFEKPTEKPPDAK